MQFAIDG